MQPLTCSKQNFDFPTEHASCCVLQISMRTSQSFSLFTPENSESFSFPYVASYFSFDSRANPVWTLFRLYLDSDLGLFLFLAFPTASILLQTRLSQLPPTSTFSFVRQCILNTTAKMIPLKLQQCLKILQCFPIPSAFSAPKPTQASFKCQHH